MAARGSRILKILSCVGGECCVDLVNDLLKRDFELIEAAK
jgi:hypothetical protein